MPTKAIFPNLYANVIYDLSGEASTLFQKTNVERIENVMDRSSLKKLFDIHSREDNMFICLNKNQIKASENDIIVVTDVEWNHENDCYSRCYHKVTNNDIQILNIYNDSISNGTKLKYYLFKKNSVVEILPKVDTWRQDGHSSNPRNVMSFKVGNTVKETKEHEEYISRKYNGYMQLNKKIRSKRKNYTSTTITYDNEVSNYVQFGVEPKDYQFSKTILVDMQWTSTAGDQTTMGVFSDGDTLLAFYQPELADGTSSWVPNADGENTLVGPLGAAQCRGVTTITQALIDQYNPSNSADGDRTNDTYKVPILLHMNHEMSENFYFGVQYAATPGQITLYKASIFEPYKSTYIDPTEPDNLYCHPIARPSVDIKLSSVKSDQWLWFSKPFGSGPLPIHNLEYYIGNIASGNWDIIKTQTDIVYIVGGVEYGTKRFTDLNVENTFFNIHFAKNGTDQSIEQPDGFSSSIVPHDVDGDGVVTDEVFTEHIYTWVAYNNLVNSTISSTVDGYLRSQYNFEQMSSSANSNLMLQPGQGYKFYPFTTAGTHLALTANTDAGAPDNGVIGITDNLSNGTYISAYVEDLSGKIGNSVKTDIVSSFDETAGLEKDKFIIDITSGNISYVANGNLVNKSDNDPTWGFSATGLTDSSGNPITDADGNQVNVYIPSEANILNNNAFGTPSSTTGVEGGTRDIYSMGAILGSIVKTYGIVNQTSTTFGIDMDYALGGISLSITPIYFIVSEQRTGNTVAGQSYQFDSSERQQIYNGLLKFLRDPSYLNGNPDPQEVNMPSTQVYLGTWMYRSEDRIISHYTIDSSVTPLNTALASSMINTTGAPTFGMNATGNSFSFTANGVSLMTVVGDDSDTTQAIGTVAASAQKAPSGTWDFGGDGRGGSTGWDFYYTSTNLYLTYKDVVQQVNLSGSGISAVLGSDATLQLEIVPNMWVFQVEPDTTSAADPVNSTNANMALLHSDDNGISWTELYSLGGPNYTPTSYIVVMREDI